MFTQQGEGSVQADSHPELINQSDLNSVLCLIQNQHVKHVLIWLSEDNETCEHGREAGGSWRKLKYYFRNNISAMTFMQTAGSQG